MYQGWAYPMPPSCEVRAASAITKFKDAHRDYGWGFLFEDLGVCYHYRRTRVVPFMILLQHTAGLGTSKIKVIVRNILQSKKRGPCSPEPPTLCSLRSAHPSKIFFGPYYPESQMVCSFLFISILHKNIKKFQNQSSGWQVQTEDLLQCTKNRQYHYQLKFRNYNSGAQMVRIAQDDRETHMDG